MNTNYTTLIAAHAMNLDSIGNNMRKFDFAGDEYFIRNKRLSGHNFLKKIASGEKFADIFA